MNPLFKRECSNWTEEINISVLGQFVERKQNELCLICAFIFNTEGSQYLTLKYIKNNNLEKHNFSRITELGESYLRNVRLSKKVIISVDSIFFMVGLFTIVTI